jgi:hypothetical protein
MKKNCVEHIIVFIIKNTISKITYNKINTTVKWRVKVDGNCNIKIIRDILHSEYPLLN